MSLLLWSGFASLLLLMILLLSVRRRRAHEREHGGDGGEPQAAAGSLCPNNLVRHQWLPHLLFCSWAIVVAAVDEGSCVSWLMRVRSTET